LDVSLELRVSLVKDSEGGFLSLLPSYSTHRDSLKPHETATTYTWVTVLVELHQPLVGGFS